MQTTAEVQQFYVYVLCRPDGTPFYVGKGQQYRMFAHEREARRTDCTCAKCEVIRDIKAAGGSIDYQIVMRTDNNQQAVEQERELITFYGYDQLTNKPPVNHRRPGGGRKPTNGEGIERHQVGLRPSDWRFLRTIDPQWSRAIRKLIDLHKEQK